MTAETASPSSQSPRLNRQEAVPRLVGDPSDFLIVTGLAGPAKDIGHLTQEAPNAFLFGGAMGGAVPAALGLALAQPDRRVLCVTGDGDLLMSMGTLATIGALGVANLAVVCVDNALYQETGGQTSHTAMGVDLAAIASGAGFGAVRTVNAEDQLADASTLLRQSNGPAFVLLQVDGTPPPKYLRNWNAAERKAMFRRHVLGS
ncbi:MAG: thiamine pyrophosphate-dependent enzyme [Pseudomonadota bacterium]